MEQCVIDEVSFTVDVGSLLAKLRLDANSDDAHRLKQLVSEAISIGKPKGLYKVMYIDEKDDNRVTVNGVTLISRVLRANLDSAGRVFPFVATCGRELEEWSSQFTDVLDKYFVDNIKEAALRAALSHLRQHLLEHVNPGKISMMNPGSLEDWPISEQVKLFELLGDAVSELGVTLTESYLMVPIKSVSGIWFSTDVDFENCALCLRENCPNRRAPFDDKLYAERLS